MPVGFYASGGLGMSQKNCFVLAFPLWILKFRAVCTESSAVAFTSEHLLAVRMPKPPCLKAGGGIRTQDVWVRRQTRWWQLTARADHALGCAWGTRNARHNLLRDQLAALIAEAGGRAQSEQMVAEYAPHVARKADVRASFGPGALRIYYDIVVAHPFKTRVPTGERGALLNATPEADAAVKTAERRKRNDYAPPANDAGALLGRAVAIVPMAFDTHGRWGPAAVDAVRRCARRLLRMPDAIRSVQRKGLYLKLLASWRAEASCLLMRGLGLCSGGAGGGDGEHPEGERGGVTGPTGYADLLINRLCLTFSVDDATTGRSVELVPGGSDKDVTAENVAEYVKLRTEWELEGRFVPVMPHVQKGFYCIVPPDILEAFSRMVTAEELDVMLTGHGINIQDWRQNTEYYGYDENSDIIKWFWDAVEGFTPQELEDLWTFISGSKGVPPGGFGNLTNAAGEAIRFTIAKVTASAAHLPVKASVLPRLLLLALGHASFEPGKLLQLVFFVSLVTASFDLAIVSLWLWFVPLCRLWRGSLLFASRMKSEISGHGGAFVPLCSSMAAVGTSASAATDLFGVLRDRRASEDELEKAARSLASTGNLKGPRDFTQVLSAFARRGLWQKAAHWLQVMQETGLKPDVFARSVIISACEKGGQWQAALAQLSEIRQSRDQPDVVAYSSAISSLASCSSSAACWQLAFALLDEMRAAALRPNVVTYSAAMSAVQRGSHWPAALALLDELLASDKGAADVVVLGAAVSACAQGGHWEGALALLREAPETWPRLREAQRGSGEQRSLLMVRNAAISACERAGRWQVALCLLSEMCLGCSNNSSSSVQKPPAPDVVSYSSTISACGAGSQWPWSLALLTEMGSRNLQPTVVVTYGAALGSCAQGDQWERALALLVDMKAAGVEINDVALKAAASACERAEVGSRSDLPLSLPSLVPSTSGLLVQFCIIQGDQRGRVELRGWLSAGTLGHEGLLRGLMMDGAWPSDVSASLFVGGDALHLTSGVQQLVMTAQGCHEDGRARYRPATLRNWEDVLWRSRGPDNVVRLSLCGMAGEITGQELCYAIGWLCMEASDSDVQRCGRAEVERERGGLLRVLEGLDSLSDYTFSAMLMAREWPPPDTKRHLLEPGNASPFREEAGSVSKSKEHAGNEAEGSSAEDTLLRFIAAQEGNPLLDPRFALRVCSERGLVRAMVLLYGLMGMHEEAVEVALQHEDIALAKHSACKPPDSDRRLRQKLWLRIVENQALTGDVQKITGLIRESQELTVRDVLPFMSDSMTIDAFQSEICECLDSYEGQIVTLRQEMDDHRRALTSFKEDLKQAEERCVVIAPDQACEICGAAVVRERFYAFACSHCFHEACLRALVLPSLEPERKERFFKLEATRLQHQAAAAGAAPSPGQIEDGQTLAEVEDELDSILADDCPLCGQLMIDTILRPFIDPDEEAEVESWAIK
ncbi:unnamed protein product [Polarella glacialis]|uniref:HECT domain-containing protein n=2 Tax=Polarella glacialis TaxID=89957 RepID=A0A813KZZ2_POLGL|nr:unnamed protein product [Polarella glacialis]